MVYYAGMYGNSVLLQHHGILGMKWGKQNGPPYPLGTSDHSASEKKAGWRKSLSKSSNDSSKSPGANNDNSPKECKKLTSKQKRNIAVTVAALAVIGGTSYYLYKTGKLDFLAKAGRKAVENTEILGDTIVPKRLLQKETIDDTIKLANPTGSSQNCVASSFAGFLRQQGLNVTAKDVKVSPEELVQKCFKNANSETVKHVRAEGFAKSPTDAAKFLLKRLGSEGEGYGMISIPWLSGKGHEFDFRVREGRVLFFDSQQGIKGKDLFKF